MADTAAVIWPTLTIAAGKSASTPFHAQERAIKRVHVPVGTQGATVVVLHSADGVSYGAASDNDGSVIASPFAVLVV